ncbi:MAG: hypothetical protein JRC68_00095 [Deltaproteobacteria bacterium]|nr:hypothetical protein [Deltaproteobacteria bacterium]
MESDTVVKIMTPSFMTIIVIYEIAPGTGMNQEDSEDLWSSHEMWILVCINH